MWKVIIYLPKPGRTGFYDTSDDRLNERVGFFNEHRPLTIPVGVGAFIAPKVELHSFNSTMQKCFLLIVSTSPRFMAVGQSDNPIYIAHNLKWIHNPSKPYEGRHRYPLKLAQWLVRPAPRLEAGSCREGPLRARHEHHRSATEIAYALS